MEAKQADRLVQFHTTRGQNIKYPPKDDPLNVYTYKPIFWQYDLEGYS